LDALGERIVLLVAACSLAALLAHFLLTSCSLLAHVPFPTASPPLPHSYILGIPVLFYAVLKLAREENVTKCLIDMRKNENLQARYLAMARADIEVSGKLYVVPDNDEEVREVVGSFLRRKNLRSHKLLSQIGFIVESYQEHAWFYEMWELVRKLFLVGVSGAEKKERRRRRKEEGEGRRRRSGIDRWY